MERRFHVRLAELLNDAHVLPNLLRGILPRLQTFLQPFLDALQTPQQQTNAHHYVQGLLSELGSNDVESIAYLHDRERQGLQKFIGQADWTSAQAVVPRAQKCYTRPTLRGGFYNGMAAEDRVSDRAQLPLGQARLACLSCKMAKIAHQNSKQVASLLTRTYVWRVFLEDGQVR
jgi:hypothetical protein